MRPMPPLLDRSPVALMLFLLTLLTFPVAAQSETPPPPSPTPELTATPAADGPTLELYWLERYLILYSPPTNTDRLDVTLLDLRGSSGAFIEGETWFRASFQYLEPERCVFIYQFDFSGGEEPPFLEDALYLNPDLPCANDDAYYIGVSLEDAVWMTADGEFTASYADTETATCQNADAACLVPLTVDLPENSLALFWNQDIMVLLNPGKNPLNLTGITLTNETNTLTPLADLAPFLADLPGGRCLAFYALDVAPQPRLPANVTCVEVIATQQIAPSDFVWYTGSGFTVNFNGTAFACNTFSRTSCVIAPPDIDNP